MITKETKYYHYEIDDTLSLKVWHKEDFNNGLEPFVEQPFNPETGLPFASAEEVELFYVSRYGTEETEINPFPEVTVEG